MKKEIDRKINLVMQEIQNMCDSACNEGYPDEFLDCFLKH